MFGPFAGEEGGPVRGGGEAFAVGRAEGEEDGEAAFAEGRVGFEGETFLEFDLGFGLPAGVGDFQGAVVGPRDGEGHQLIQPTGLAFFQVTVESGSEGRGLGFSDEREAGEGAGEAGGDGGFVEGGELQFGDGGLDEVDAGNELFQPMIQQGQVEGSGAVGFGKAASAGGGIEIALLRGLLDHEIVITHQLHGGDAFVFGIEAVLDGGG